MGGEVKSILDVHRLKRNRYTLSLISEAEAAGLLTQAQAQSLHMQVMEVLKDAILRRNAGSSSSIRTEAAQDLLLAVLCCMDARCRDFATPEECLQQLLSSGAAVFYQEGLEIVLACLKETKTLYKKVAAGRLHVELLAYNDTIDKAIPAFFSKYDVMSGTHETPCAVDYPLAHDDTQAEGIFYIRQYLQKLDMENRFCRLFGEDAISGLLERYGEVCGICWRDYLLNIYEIVLNQALFSVMLGFPPRIDLGPAELETLRSKLAVMSSMKVSASIRAAALRLTAAMGYSGTEMGRYIGLGISDACIRLNASIENDTLGKLVIV